MLCYFSTNWIKFPVVKCFNLFQQEKERELSKKLDELQKEFRYSFNCIILTSHVPTKFGTNHRYLIDREIQHQQHKSMADHLPNNVKNLAHPQYLSFLQCCVKTWCILCLSIWQTVSTVVFGILFARFLKVECIAKVEAFYVITS